MSHSEITWVTSAQDQAPGEVVVDGNESPRSPHVHDRRRDGDPVHSLPRPGSSQEDLRCLSLTGRRLRSGTPGLPVPTLGTRKRNLRPGQGEEPAGVFSAVQRLGVPGTPLSPQRHSYVTRAHTSGRVPVPGKSEKYLQTERGLKRTNEVHGR